MPEEELDGPRPVIVAGPLQSLVTSVTLVSSTENNIELKIYDVDGKLNQLHHPSSSFFIHCELCLFSPRLPIINVVVV